MFIIADIHGWVDTDWTHNALLMVFVAICLAGGVMMLFGGIRFLIAAFRTSVLWGLGCLLVPFCKLFYLIMHWEEAKSGFFLYLKGAFVIILGGMLAAVVIPNFDAARANQRAHAKEHLAAGQTDNDPSATNSIEKGQTAANPSHQTLRLQGVFYNSTRPSAIINGNTVFVGEKVNGWSVTTISNKTVTLQNDSGKINTLSMN